MGWWKRRTQRETLNYCSRNIGQVRIGFESGNLEFYDGMEICSMILGDLPMRIEGKGGRDSNLTVRMLEDHVPGMAEALYEWFEPGSQGELIGELISSWRGDATNDKKEPQEDT